MEVIEIKVENPFFKQVEHLCLKIENSIFVPFEQAKHFCMISVKKLYEDVEEDVETLVMLFMFGFVKPITYEKAIRTTLDNILWSCMPGSPFHCVNWKIKNFKFTDCPENETGCGFGEIGDPRRLISRHNPPPKYAGYMRETRTIEQVRKFLCCICSSCGEFQIAHHNSWVDTLYSLSWSSEDEEDWDVQFRYSCATWKTQCTCGLDGEYGKNSV